jgi:hypothetical protein
LLRVYDDIAQYKAQFTGADLSRFAFNEVSRKGESRYITAEAEQSQQGTDMTYPLADFYGFKTGELVTEDAHNVKVMRIATIDSLRPRRPRTRVDQVARHQLRQRVIQ